MYGRPEPCVNSSGYVDFGSVGEYRSNDDCSHDGQDQQRAGIDAAVARWICAGSNAGAIANHAATKGNPTDG